eukprot:Gb_09047 [translate_table: standard]
MAASLLPSAPRLSFEREISIAELPERSKCRQTHACKLEKSWTDGPIGLQRTIISQNRGAIVESRRKFVELGCCLLAATMAMPMQGEADAAEEQSEEPSCELTFAPSGLGYCDLVVGTGVEPPLGELINVRLNYLLYN